MNTSATEELIGAMSELRMLLPEWRMGQLVANLVTAAGGMDTSAIWDVEDEKLLAAARRLIERNRGRGEIRAAGASGSRHSSRTKGRQCKQIKLLDGSFARRRLTSLGLLPTDAGGRYRTPCIPHQRHYGWFEG
jgi:hypothetical protein